MSKEERNKVVPELRFPEFRNDGNWVEKSLGECLLKHPEYGIGAAAVPYSISLPTYLRITDISEDGSFLKSQKVSVAMEVTTENYLDDGDIVFARTGASVGKSYKYRIADGKLVFAGFLIRIKPNTNKLNSEFLYQYLSTERYWRWVDFTSTRSGQPGINSNEYALLPVPLPPFINEQQKIADCLSSLDDLLTAENGKLEALKAYKKGLMQQLFPAEGETVPKLRFAEFRDGGEWVERALDEVGKFVGGGTPSKSNQTYWKGNIPWISSSDIDEESIHQITISRFINDEALEDSATKLIPPNSILLVSRVGVGKLAITRKAICTSQDFTNLTPDNDDVIFLAYYLKSLSKTLLAFSQGMAIKGFTKDDVSKLKLFIPTLKEQQKIAECLSSLDEFITAQAQKIEALTQHKKGLLQGLFPGAADT